jgi:hypothetical protein
MKSKLLAIISILFAITLSFVWQQASAQEFRVEGVGLEATPSHYTGPCPGLIKFRGKIQSSAAGRVKYTYSYSDGGSGPEGFVDFSGPGVRTVETEWRLGDATSLPRFDGWAMLKVISPNSYDSNKATFLLECGRGAPQPPREQPQPKPNPGAGKSEQIADADMKRMLDKKMADERSVRAQKERVIKSFAESVAPKMSAAESKLGIDRAAIEKEMKAIAAEPDIEKRITRYKEAKVKYDPLVQKLYQESGINVAEEKQRLMRSLGLDSAKMKATDSMTIESKPDPSIATSGFASSHYRSSFLINAAYDPQQNYRFRFQPPFQGAGVGGDGAVSPVVGASAIGDREGGLIYAHHGIALAGGFGTSAWIAEGFDARPEDRRVRAAVDFQNLGWGLYANAFIAGYSYTEAFGSIAVLDNSRLDEQGLPTVMCESRKSLATAIAVMWGFPGCTSTCR